MGHSFSGLQDHTPVQFTVNHYLQGLIKAYMSDILILILRLQAIQEINIEISLFNVRINCKVTYAERCQVLKEMSSLTGVNPVIFKPRFHNYPRCRDLLPSYRDAQPWIG